MNKYHESVIDKIIRFAPELKEYFSDAEYFERRQITQLQSFMNYLKSGEKTKEYSVNLADYLRDNKYFDTNEKVILKNMFDDLNTGFSSFDNIYKYAIENFNEKMDHVYKSGRLFSESLSETMIDHFLDSIELLNAIRMKCLSYVALTCVMKEQIEVVPSNVMIKLLEETDSIVTNEIPNAFRALKYYECFTNSLLFFS